MDEAAHADVQLARRSLLGRIIEEISSADRPWAFRYLPAAGLVVIAGCEFVLDHFEADFEGTMNVVVARLTGIDPQNVYNECPADAERFDGWRWRTPLEFWRPMLEAQRPPAV